jgi:hypothetical protein
MAAIVVLPKFRAWVPSTGALAASYVVRTFAAGTSTPLAVYTDAGLTVPAANPFVLDANGEAVVYAAAGVNYKFQLYDPTNITQQWSVDNVTIGGGSSSSTTASEWVIDSAVPTFIGTTQFSFSGDRTGTYHVNRRVRASVTAGTIYGTITAASFGGGITTVTVTWDSGQLDSGLSQISYGILDSINVSYPASISSGGSSGSSVLVVNGGFDIWQRGAGGTASFTTIAARAYTADRWQAQHTGGNATVTQVAGSVGRYGFKLQRTAGNAVTAAVQMAQSMEINDCIALTTQGTPLSISLNLKAGANFSATSNNVVVTIFAGKDASDTNVLAGYTSSLTVATATFGITTTSTRYSVSGTIPGASGYTEFGVTIQFTPTGTAGADDSITVEKVQLEGNSAATTYSPVAYGVTYQRCLRYYEKSFAYATAPAQNVGLAAGCSFIFTAGKAGAVASTMPSIGFQTSKRVAPTFASFNPLNTNAQIRDNTAVADCTAFAGTATERGFLGSFTANAGTAVGNAMCINWTADSDIP